MYICNAEQQYTEIQLNFKSSKTVNVIMATIISVEGDKLKLILKLLMMVGVCC